jgi:recombination protein RecA
LSLSPGATAFIKKMNTTLKDELLVPADQLAVPRRFTTGCLSADVILGGGWPGNQWAEIVGKSSAGKTFLVLKSIAANQKLDPNFTALWVAAEGYNNEWAESLGVDNDRVVAVPTQQMETALQVMLEGLGSQEFDAIVLDSFPALIPSEEALKAMDEFTTAVGARTLGKFVRKAGESGRRKYDGSERPFFGVIINQYRDLIGGFAKFGTPQTTPGGHGKDYFYYCRVEVSRKEWIKEKRPGIDEPVIVGQTQRIKTIKNKSAAPQQQIDVDLFVRRCVARDLDRGDYDTASEFFTIGRATRIIGTKGAWYTFGGQQWNGKDAMKQAIREDAALRDALAREVLVAAADPRRLDEVAG